MASTVGALAGKTAVVTGSGGGIGRAICQLFAKNGASLAVLSHNMDKCKATVDTLEGPGEFHPFSADVSSAEDVTRVYKEVLETFPEPPTVLVNGAGILKDSFILKMDQNLFDEVISVNLKSIFLVTQAMVKAMTEKNMKGGAIVNMSSLSGKVGVIGSSHYAASKSGIVAFTKSSAKEFARYGIRCNALMPGLIETEMMSPMPDKVKQSFLDDIVMGRFGKPEEVAEACLFLASDQSSYTTATALEISGGMYA